MTEKVVIHYQIVFHIKFKLINVCSVPLGMLSLSVHRNSWIHDTYVQVPSSDQFCMRPQCTSSLYPRLHWIR